MKKTKTHKRTGEYKTEPMIFRKITCRVKRKKIRKEQKSTAKIFNLSRVEFKRGYREREREREREMRLGRG